MAELGRYPVRGISRGGQRNGGRLCAGQGLQALQKTGSEACGGRKGERQTRSGGPSIWGAGLVGV
jgi:hypothetical protein